MVKEILSITNRCMELLVIIKDTNTVMSQYSSHAMSPDSLDSDKASKSARAFSSSVAKNFHWRNSCQIPANSRGPFILLPLALVSGSFSVTFAARLWPSALVTVFVFAVTFSSRMCTSLALVVSVTFASRLCSSLALDCADPPCWRFVGVVIEKFVFELLSAFTSACVYFLGVSFFICRFNFLHSAGNPGSVVVSACVPYSSVPFLSLFWRWLLCIECLRSFFEK